MTELEYIKNLLPSHYEIKVIRGGVDCISKEGIKDAEKWIYIREAIRNFLGDRFQEIYHTTCTNHIYFTIFYEPNLEDNGENSNRRQM